MKRTAIQFLRQWVSLVLSATLCLAVATAQAQPVSSIENPVKFMETVSNNLLAQLKTHKAELSNREIMSEIIRQYVIPYFDDKTMARSVVGRIYWQEATPEEQKEFITAFSDMIINHYGTAVADYDDDVLEFYPIRGYQDQKVVSVRSKLVRKTGQEFSVVYKLRRVDNTWRVYDFNIESISLVYSHRSQFSGVLRQGGLKALIARVKAHNVKLASNGN